MTQEASFKTTAIPRDEASFVRALEFYRRPERVFSKDKDADYWAVKMAEMNWCFFTEDRYPK